MARKYKLGAMAVSMFDSQYAAHDPHFTMSKQVTIINCIHLNLVIKYKYYIGEYFLPCIRWAGGETMR